MQPSAAELAVAKLRKAVGATSTKKAVLPRNKSQGASQSAMVRRPMTPVVQRLTMPGATAAKARQQAAGGMSQRTNDGSEPIRQRI
jgi:hypothetical protein